MYTLYICKFKRLIAALGIAALLLPLSGCDGSIYANFREVDTMQLVQTLGLDSEKPHVRVTISTGAGTESMPGVVISRKAESIVTAMRSLQDYSAKEELYFSHTRYALLGEAAAKGCFGEFIDYVLRNTKLRMDTVPFVVRGGDAKSLITLSGEESYEITEALSAVERDIKQSGLSYPFSCREVSRSLSEYGGALVCAVARKKTEDSVFSKSGELTVVPAGYAILKDGKLAGFLDLDESRGANLLTNRYGIGAIDLKLSGGETYSLLPDESSCELRAVFDESGRLRQLQAKVKISAGLTETSSPLAPLDPDTEKMLSAALSEKVESWCGAALSRSVKTRCDFLGLYGILLKQYPRELSKETDDFMTVLSEAELSVLVEGSVKHSYNLQKPVATNGEENSNAKQ